MKYLCVAFLILFTSCSNKTPEDFSVNIDYSGESYNSKTGNFTRKYNFTEKSVKILLSTEQKLKLYELYSEIDFLSFPTEFECDSSKPGGVIPSFWFDIEVTANGIIKSSGTSTKCDNKIEMNKEAKLKMFYDEIVTMIREDKAYKSLPESDRISL